MIRAVPVVSSEPKEGPHGGGSFRWDSLRDCCEAYHISSRDKLLSFIIEPDSIWHGIVFDWAWDVTDAQIMELTAQYYRRNGRNGRNRRSEED